MEKMTDLEIKEKLQDLGLEGFLHFIADRSNLKIESSMSYDMTNRGLNQKLNRSEVKIIGDHNIEVNDFATLSLIEYEDRYDFVIEVTPRYYGKPGEVINILEFTRNVFEQLGINGDTVTGSIYRSSLNPALPMAGAQLVILK